jgi:molybdopterin-binding protein
MWACGAAGSALPWHGRGRRFDPDQVHQSPDYPLLHSVMAIELSLGMTLSARNQLKGTIEEIQLGGVMAHVAVRVGENVIESVITRRSAEEMALKKGDTVKVVIKSTEVMLQKD